MKLACLGCLLGACAADAPPAPFVLADHLVMPCDLQVAGDQVYSLQYDGSIVVTSGKTRAMTTVVPAERTVGSHEIPVDLDGYNLVVTPTALYWTSQASGLPTVRRSALDGTAAVVLDTGDAPFCALVATPTGACWAGESRIACASDAGVTTLIDGRAEPRAFALAGSTLYFVEPASLFRRDGAPLQGDGGLYAVLTTGGAVQTLATGLDDPRALVTVGTHIYWLDGGSRTCHDGLCMSNLDAALHVLDLGAPAAGARVVSNGYAAVDDGLAATDDAIYFVSDARLRRRPLGGIELPGDVTLVSDATMSCSALAVAGSTLYCAGSDSVTGIAAR
jgi:hypothetical protein